jgi:hypothetical protein
MTTRKPRKGSKVKADKFARTLQTKVGKAVITNKRKRVKPPYVTPYLLSAVGKVTQLPAITKAQARDAGAPVVVIDARKVVRTVKPTLWVRPDNTVRARLITLAALDAKVAKVSYLRFLANNHPDIRPDSDDAYKVILFRVK